MARYRKISPCIWNDAKVRGLSDKGKLTLFLLLTHPNMTSLGALRANLPGLACELGWRTSVFARAFRELLDCGMARQDADAQLIWFPKFLRHNAPESPNVVRGWAAAFELLPMAYRLGPADKAATGLAAGVLTMLLGISLLT